MKRINYYLIFPLWLFSSNGFSQTATLPTGGEANGAGGTSSYSIGQVAYTTISGSVGSSAQGVQHSYEISDVSVFTMGENLLELSVYPNPTADFIIIQLEEISNEALSFQLVNSRGQIVQNGSLFKETTQITLAEYQSAYYMLHIINNNQIARTFKVLKTN
ncbi:MAG: hypothetical protein ACJA1C_001240 [Crocinitomicaceae bacterium]|jgi:hypothetical protein